MAKEVDSTTSPKTVEPVSAEELGKLRDAISQRFGVNLQPGEAMTVDAERDQEKCWVRIDITAADDSFHLDVEAVALALDAPVAAKWDANTLFDDVLDFIDVQLGEYFENERHHFFHDDWRQYEFETSVLRFRGQETRPNVDALADAWLAEHDTPEPGEPN